METIPIADQQIKGLRVRDLIVIITCTASIVVTVLTAYFNLQSTVTKNTIFNSGEAKVYELRLSIEEATSKALQLQVDALKTEIFISRRNIENK